MAEDQSTGAQPAEGPATQGSTESPTLRTIDVSAPDPVPTVDGYMLAGPFERFAAYALDYLVLLGMLTLLSWIVSLLAGATPFDVSGVWPQWASAAAAVWVLYFLLFWWMFSATPGKFLLGMRIVNKAGNPMGPLRTIIRLTFWSLTHVFLFVGFLFILFNSRFQGLHDIIAGTFVINRRLGRVRYSQAPPQPI